jgi:DNA-binding transcriptional LysR family regulator
VEFAETPNFRDLEHSGIEFRHLIVLESAARHGQLILAAEELNISPSHVSRSITQIEEILGVRLCDRSRAGVVFTESGKLFLAHVREVLSAAGRTLEFGRELATFNAGLLRVGILPAAIKFGVQDHIAMIRAAKPSVQFKIELQVSSAALVDALITDDLDIAYLEPPLEDPSLDTLEVGRCGWSLAVSPDHELARRKSIGLKEIEGLTLFQDHPVLWAEAHAQLVRLCREQGFVPKLDYSQPNGFARLILVGAGIGASIAPEVFGSDQFDRTVYVPIRDPDMSPFVMVAAWRRSKDNPIVEHWIEAAQKLIS